MLPSSRVGLLLSLSLCSLAASQAIPPFDLEGVIDTLRGFAHSTPLLTPTGLNRDAYLPTIHSIVTHFLPFQSPDGRIVDPYAKMEIQYSTPTFAFAAATLYTATGPGAGNATLLEAASLALDSATFELLTSTSAQGHANFYTYPVCRALLLLAPHVTNATRLAMWRTRLSTMPTSQYANLQMNWGLVAVAGEYVKTEILKLGNGSWWRAELARQIVSSRFTGSGMYLDDSGFDGILSPMPYSTFPTKYMTALLFDGLNGTDASPLLWSYALRGGWTHVAQQSPRGEIATGGRSSQHSWNEACSAVTQELWSEYYRSTGDLASACAFKRAARLSLRSVNRWVGATGALQVVKNWADPSLRWGYEVYSYATNYNLLPASMLSAAWAAADPADTLAECASLADVGGAVFALPEFRKIVANGGGVYLEIETGADPHYDSTGLTRFHVDQSGTLPASSFVRVHGPLGPSAGSPQDLGGSGVGVWWARAGDPPGTRRRLGNATYADVTAAVLTPGADNTPASVQFTVDYILLAQGLLITETYVTHAANASVSITGGVSVVGAAAAREWLTAVRATGTGAPHLLTAHAPPPRPLPLARGSAEAAAAGGDITAFGVGFPALQWDGSTNVTWTLPPSPAASGSVVGGTPAWGEVVFSTAIGSGHTLSWAWAPPINVRNGIAQAADVTVDKITTNAPNLSYSLTGKGQGLA